MKTTQVVTDMGGPLHLVCGCMHSFLRFYRLEILCFTVFAVASSCSGALVQSYQFNMATKYFCECPTGTLYNGTQCVHGTPICKPTSLSMPSCSTYPTCTPIATTPNYQCVCPAGFNISSDGHVCENVDECTSHSHTCTGDEVCEDTYGNFTCTLTCKAGYFGKSKFH